MQQLVFLERKQMLLGTLLAQSIWVWVTIWVTNRSFQMIFSLTLSSMGALLLVMLSCAHSILPAPIPPDQRPPSSLLFRSTPVYARTIPSSGKSRPLSLQKPKVVTCQTQTHASNQGSETLDRTPTHPLSRSQWVEVTFRPMLHAPTLPISWKGLCRF